MNYFCAQCQRRHPIHDLAADLRDISREEIAEQLDKIFYTPAGQEENDKRNALSNNLKKFVRDEERSGKYFLFKSDEISKYLQKMRRDGYLVTGHLCLTLEWLLDKYEESGAYEADRNASQMPDFDELSLLEKQKPVFDQEINFYFDKIGNEEVLNYMTDDRGDPFTYPKDGPNEKKVMRGFLRACPHCGYHVPRAVGRADEIVVALAGSPRAGKSSCLVAIASALASGRYGDFGLSMEIFNNDKSWEELKKEIDSFNEGYAVEKTPVDLKTVPSYSLLVRCGRKRRVLTFVDMPGEFWQTGGGLSTDFYTQYAGIYRNIDCIWFFISKMTAYSLKSGAISKDLIRQSSEREEIIQNANADNLRANLSSLREHLSASGQRIPPVAVILSKVEMELGAGDVVHTGRYELFPVENGALITTNEITAKNKEEMNKILKRNAGREDDRVFNEEEYFKRANGVREFFRAQNPGFCKAVEENCPFRTYISMSAYGHPAGIRGEERKAEFKSLGISVEENDVHQPTPYHEMFPLIWTMAIMGAAKIEHSYVVRRRDFWGRNTDTPRLVVLEAFRYRRPNGNAAAGNQGQIEQLAAKNVAQNLLMTNPGAGEVRRVNIIQS